MPSNEARLRAVGGPRVVPVMVLVGVRKEYHEQDRRSVGTSLPTIICSSLHLRQCGRKSSGQGMMSIEVSIEVRIEVNG